MEASEKQVAVSGQIVDERALRQIVSELSRVLGDLASYGNVVGIASQQQCGGDCNVAALDGRYGRLRSDGHCSGCISVRCSVAIAIANRQLDKRRPSSLMRGFAVMAPD